MILSLDKHGALYVFASLEDVCRQLEAIDVQREAFEFCDDQDQQYSPVYTRPPRESRIGPFGIVDIGAFELTAEGEVDAGLAMRFIDSANHIEHSSIHAITTIEALRNELQERA